MYMGEENSMQMGRRREVLLALENKQGITATYINWS